MNIAILTSNQPRHMSFVSMLSNLINPSLVIIESKKPTLFVNQEKEFFKERLGSIKTNLKYCHVEKGEINSSKIEKLLIDNNIDVAFVFGTSILKKYIFSIPKFCVNIHTGLVQEYRGVDSNFWALYENNLAAIGVTVHRINAGIDTGNILLQKRIELTPDDSIESIFLKSCESGFQLIEDNIDDILSEKIKHVKMKKRGKLFKIKNMNNIALLKVNNTIKENIKEYLQNKEIKDRKIKLINGRNDGLYY